MLGFGKRIILVVFIAVRCLKVMIKLCLCGSDKRYIAWLGDFGVRWFISYVI